MADVVGHAAGAIHHVVVPPVPPAGRVAGGAPFDEAAVERMQKNGAVIHHIDMRREPWHPANGKAVLALRAVIEQVRPDVVHGHSSVGGALARIAGPMARIPVVYTANGVAAERAYRMTERALGPLTWRWVAVSDSEAELARRLRLARPDRLVTIANGIDLQAPPPSPDLRERLGLPAGTPLVGTVSRLVPQKAPLDVVRLAASVPQAHFVLVGMGPLQAEVDAEVDRFHLRHRWHQIEHVDDAAGLVPHFDVFILASRFEGGPYTPLEAIRAGVPVVLTDVVGNRDTIVDGQSGLLAPAGDVARLSTAVRQILDDPALGRRLAAAACNRLAERFDVTRMGGQLAALYASVPRTEGRS